MDKIEFKTKEEMYNVLPPSPWISIKDFLPIDGQIIVYCAGDIIWSSTGRYCGRADPMPSAPYWLPWTNVTHWMPLPEVPK